MSDISILYKEIIKLFSSAPVSELLTRTLILAQELKNEELENWVKLELNGYFNKNPVWKKGTIIPEYRTIIGQYSNIYGAPLIIEDPKLNFIQEDRLGHGVSELERLREGAKMITIQDSGKINLIKQHLKVDVAYFSFPPSSIDGILNSIRTELAEKLKDVKHLIESEADVPEETNNVTLVLENLHPAVKNVAEKLFKDGHLRQAILDTYIALVNAVQAKSSRYDLDGSKLMQTVFSANNPNLEVSDDPDEQLGFMWLFSGSTMGFRNPNAHKIKTNPSPQETLEILGFASLLFRRLERSKNLKQ